MALQIRRGLDAERLLLTPAVAELVYTTDTKRLWVGDGVTPGGVAGLELTELRLVGDVDVNPFPPRAVATIFAFGGTVTLETVDPHGLAPGMQVLIELPGYPSLSGLYDIASTPDATTLTYASAPISILETPTTGQITPTGSNISDGTVLRWDAADAAWKPVAGTVDALYNVNIAGLADGDVIAWDATTSKWVNVARTIDQLLDVDTSTSAPVTGQVLRWNGVNWVPAKVTSSGLDVTLDALTDVDTTTELPAIGDALIYDGISWSPAVVQKLRESAPELKIDVIDPDEHPLAGPSTWYANSAAWTSAGWTVLASDTITFSLVVNVPTWLRGLTMLGGIIPASPAHGQWRFRVNGPLIGYASDSNYYSGTGLLGNNPLQENDGYEMMLAFFNDIDGKAKRIGTKEVIFRNTKYFVIRSESWAPDQYSSGKIVVEGWFSEYGDIIAKYGTAYDGGSFVAASNKNILGSSGNTISAFGPYATGFLGLTSTGYYVIQFSHRTGRLAGGRLDDLVDVDAQNATDGQTLVKDGEFFVAKDMAIVNLTDVTPGFPDQSLLQYHAGTGKWIATTAGTISGSQNLPGRGDGGDFDNTVVDVPYVFGITGGGNCDTASTDQPYETVRIGIADGGVIT